MCIRDRYKLEPLQQEINAANRGTVLHEIMERFSQAHPKEIGKNAQDDFIQITKDVLDAHHVEQQEVAFWFPRLKKLAQWTIQHETLYRESARLFACEAEGNITLNDDRLKRPFTLRGIADRIDLKNSGDMGVIDYKSGGTYNPKKMGNGELPQLPLEALILQKNGFKEAGITGKKIDEIAYWKLTGGNPAGQIIHINDKEIIQGVIDEIENSLISLIQIFENEDTPYIAVPDLENAPRFNDYEHLERLKEWAVLDDSTNEVVS